MIALFQRRLLVAHLGGTDYTREYKLQSNNGLRYANGNE